MIRIVDLSSVQGILSDADWQHLKDQGVRGAYIKCTQGNDGADPDFAANVAGARKVGIAVGPYHFAYPLPDDGVHKTRAPATQAALFRGHANGVGSDPGDMPPAVDLEWPPPEDWGKWNCTADEIDEWAWVHLMAVAKAFGRIPVVYEYPWFAQKSEVGAHPDMAQYPLWIADYTAVGRIPGPDERPRAIPPWPKATLWQHDGNGGLTLPSGRDADFSVFLGTEADWYVFIGEPELSCHGDAV